ncbi:MAG: nucleotidyltransferase family protein [Planctomycetes bacterium]|nr:nucleotidyltransferase family protein [Planctomycetota bacterium]
MDNWTLARNIIIYNELAKTLKQLNNPACQSLGAGRSNIKTIVLAGAALAQTVYPDIGSRPMSDIDLLVKRADLPLLEKSMDALGYKLEMRRSSEAHYSNNLPEFTIHIDIHTDLSFLDTRGNSEIWERAVKAALSDNETYILSPEDALIYALTYSFTGHGHIKNAAINDASWIIRKHNISWDLISTLIKRYNLEVPMYCGLMAARKKAVIDDEVLTKIKPPTRKSMEMKIYCMALNHPSEDMAPVLRFLTCPGKLRLLKDSFFPSSDFMQRRYGSSASLAVLYYPLRLIHHFWRILKLASRMM